MNVIESYFLPWEQKKLSKSFNSTLARSFYVPRENKSDKHLRHFIWRSRRKRLQSSISFGKPGIGCAMTTWKLRWANERWHSGFIHLRWGKGKNKIPLKINSPWCMEMRRFQYIPVTTSPCPASRNVNQIHVKRDFSALVFRCISLSS